MGAVPRSVEALLDGLGQRLAAGLEEHVAALMERIWSGPELRSYALPHLRDQTEEIARANLRHELTSFAGGRHLPATCPPEAAAGARAAVEFDMPITVMLACYRAAHAVLWRAWSELVDEAQVDGDLRDALLAAGSDFMFAYVDRCAAQVETEYTRIRDRRLRMEEQRRGQAVRDVLEGAPGERDGLGYRLDQHHLGIVASGSSVASALAELHVSLHRDTLVVGGGHGLWWSWVGGERPHDEKVWRALRELSGATTTLAVGTTAPGSEGFRLTHRQAMLAYEVVRRSEDQITFYEDASIEAGLLSEPALAAAFVTLHLGGLDADDQRLEVVRATVEAYLDLGANAASAAAQLGVTDRTVGNRLRSAELLLPAPVLRRPAELVTALRLRRLLRRDSTSAQVIAAVREPGRAVGSGVPRRSRQQGDRNS